MTASGAVQQIRAGHAHHPAERLGQQAPRLNLKRLDDLAQRAVIASGASARLSNEAAAPDTAGRGGRDSLPLRIGRTMAE
jgi:hypothetical protein